MLLTFQADDTGSYMCTAINVAGRDSMDRVLRVQGRSTFTTLSYQLTGSWSSYSVLQRDIMPYLQKLYQYTVEILQIGPLSERDKL